MSDAADSPIWSRSSEVLCSYSSRANDSCCLQVPYPTEPSSTTILIAMCLQISTKTWARDFLLIKLSSPPSCSHKAVCRIYMKIHVFALVQPQISRAKMYSRIKEIWWRQKPNDPCNHFPSCFSSLVTVLGRSICITYHLIFEIALEIWKGDAKVFSVNLNGFYILFQEIREPWAVWMFSSHSLKDSFLKAEGIHFPSCVPIPRVVPNLLLPFLGKREI